MRRKKSYEVLCHGRSLMTVKNNVCLLCHVITCEQRVQRFDDETSLTELSFCEFASEETPPCSVLCENFAFCSRPQLTPGSLSSHVFSRTGASVFISLFMQKSHPCFRSGAVYIRCKMRDSVETSQSGVLSATQTTPATYDSVFLRTPFSDV